MKMLLNTYIFRQLWLTSVVTIAAPTSETGVEEPCGAGPGAVEVILWLCGNWPLKCHSMAQESLPPVFRLCIVDCFYFLVVESMFLS